MVTMNIKTQNVKNQYIADVINVENVETPDDGAKALKELQQLLAQSNQNNAIASQDAKAADELINKTIEEVQSDTPDKKKVIDYLSSFTTLVSKVDGLANAAKKLAANLGSIL